MGSPCTEAPFPSPPGVQGALVRPLRRAPLARFFGGFQKRSQLWEPGPRRAGLGSAGTPELPLPGEGASGRGWGSRLTADSGSGRAATFIQPTDQGAEGRGGGGAEAWGCAGTRRPARTRGDPAAAGGRARAGSEGGVRARVSGPLAADSGILMIFGKEFPDFRTFRRRAFIHSPTHPSIPAPQVPPSGLSIPSPGGSPASLSGCLRAPVRRPPSPQPLLHAAEDPVGSIQRPRHRGDGPGVPADRGRMAQHCPLLRGNPSTTPNAWHPQLPSGRPCNRRSASSVGIRFSLVRNFSP